MNRKNARVALQKGHAGFSLLEMVITLAIIMILMAVVSPTLMTHIYATRIRYSATNLSGILQRGPYRSGQDIPIRIIAIVPNMPMASTVIASRPHRERRTR